MKHRTLNKLRAYVTGYGWNACPLCGQQFGGHEWKHGSAQTIATSTPGLRRAVCLDCYRNRLGFDNLVAALSEFYTPEGVCIWLRKRNRLMNSQRPIDLLVRGESDRVWAAIDQLRSGAYV